MTYLHTEQYSKESNEASARYRWILGVGHFCPTVLRGAWTQLHQTWRERSVIITTQEICFRVRISCCISTRAAQSWSCWKQRQISHFLTPVKIRGGVGEISIPIVGVTHGPCTACWYMQESVEEIRENNNKASGIHLMAIHCMTADCWPRWMIKM